jgi:transcriptional regulator with XRE-family HTH domain
VTKNTGYPTRQPLRSQGFSLTKPKDVRQVFREGLKAARLRLTAERGHYVTPDELGKDVGVSGQTIRNYESGASEPTLDMIEQLAGVLGVPLAGEAERVYVKPQPLKTPKELDGRSKSTRRKGNGRGGTA